MAPGGPPPPFAGEYQSVHHTGCADSTRASRRRIWLRCEPLPTDSRATQLPSPRRFLPARTTSRLRV
jgi:hypothetical protein